MSWPYFQNLTDACSVIGLTSSIVDRLLSIIQIDSSQTTHDLHYEYASHLGFANDLFDSSPSLSECSKAEIADSIIGLLDLFI
jgi:hypothetical protein